MEIIIPTDRSDFTLGEGTGHERTLRLPNDLGSRFDEAMSLIDTMVAGAESKNVFTQQQLAVKHRFQQFLPVIYGIRVVWAYTATEVTDLRKQVSDLREQLAAMDKRLEELGARVRDSP